MSLLANSNAIESGGYNIDRSLRFRSSASAYLNRTPASAGNRQKWTWSGWVKRGVLGSTSYQYYFSAAGELIFGFEGDAFRVQQMDGSGNNIWQVTCSQVFRDPSAWYHIIVSVDTTQATSSNRVKLYCNGAEVNFTSGTQPTQNYNTSVNSAAVHNIGRSVRTSAYYFDGYLAEVNFIDGQALTPSSFGQTDAVTGVWTPKKYTGTYGTNGFYLPFNDPTSATTLAQDRSGNGNNWTPNNISTTAGATYDSMTDVPTLTSATAANYCVLNPLDKSSAVTLSAANLEYSCSSGSNCRGTLGTGSTGLYYFEHKITSSIGLYTPIVVGFCTNTKVVTDLNNEALRIVFYTDSSAWQVSKGVSGAYTSINVTGTSYPNTNDVLQIAYDATNGKVWLGKNNNWIDSSGGIAGNPSSGANPTFTFTAGQSVFPALFNVGGPYSGNLNCGQRPFSYTPPTGFKALNTFNLPDPTIKKPNQYMDATTYTGTGSALSVVNAGGFQPDLVWVKGRSGATDHALYDAVRGTTKQLESNTATAETTEATGLTAFNSNGFSVGALAQMNTNTATYVGWQWKESATAGFDIVTYTGTGAARTVAHSLGVAPKMMIVRRRNGAGYDAWVVYNANLNGGVTPANYYLYLQTTSGQDAYGPFFNNTMPTSTDFTVGTDAFVNASGSNYVAYLFAEIPQFSKAFNFTGNGSADGSFMYLGFKPKLVLLKCSSTSGNWYLFDTVRNTYNVLGEQLYPNLSNAGSAVTTLDALSNGFKMRLSGDPNASQTYIGFAWADVPFKFSNAF